MGFSALSEDEQLAHMEFNLSIAMHMECCSPYLYERKEVLIPEMVKQANKEGKDVDGIVARFVKGLHERRQGV